MSRRAVVAGAGVVGLALGRQLAKRGHEVIILEMNQFCGRETSSRNSEVIHAGLYYATGSLKAKTCLKGKRMLYDFCEEFNVPHKRCGKLIVASDDSQTERLDNLLKKSIDNGMISDDDRLSVLSEKEVKKMEPQVKCSKALFSPSTGIIDSYSYINALLGDAEAFGAMVSVNTKVLSVTPVESGLEVSTVDLSTKEIFPIECDSFFNCIGLAAPILSKKALKDISDYEIPEPRFAKGNYFKLTGSPLGKFSHLVYPLPFENIAGLGVHLTIDLEGNARFGPDLEWLNYDLDKEESANYNNEIDYKVNPSRGDSFYESVRTYLPGLEDGSLVPDYSGIRPKLSISEGKEQDFMILGPKEHGASGQYHLLGIDSPGLTASLALAEEVVDRLEPYIN